MFILFVLPFRVFCVLINVKQKRPTFSIFHLRTVIDPPPFTDMSEKVGFSAIPYKKYNLDREINTQRLEREVVWNQPRRNQFF